MAKTESKTSKEKNFGERIFGGEHYKTMISDGNRKIEAHGQKANEAEERASKKWKK